MSISISWPSILNITTLDTGLPTLGETRVLHRYPAVCKKEKLIPFILLHWTSEWVYVVKIFIQVDFCPDDLPLPGQNMGPLRATVGGR